MKDQREKFPVGSMVVLIASIMEARAGKDNDLKLPVGTAGTVRGHTEDGRAIVQFTNLHTHTFIYPENIILPVLRHATDTDRAEPCVFDITALARLRSLCVNLGGETKKAWDVWNDSITKYDVLPPINSIARELSRLVFDGEVTPTA